MLKGACVRARAQAPPAFEREEVRERLRRLPGGPAQPLTVHLRQEVDRLNGTIALAMTTLQNLRLAIAGVSCDTRSIHPATVPQVPGKLMVGGP